MVISGLLLAWIVSRLFLARYLIVSTSFLLLAIVLCPPLTALIVFYGLGVYFLEPLFKRRP